MDVLFVTADDERALTRGLRKHGLEGTFLQVEPALWSHWGVANPKRAKLPVPGSVVVAPDGTLLLVELHEDYKVRSDPAAVLAAVAASSSR